MLAISTSLAGSTGAWSTGVFHASPLGNGMRPWRSAPGPRSGTPGTPGGGGATGGGFGDPFPGPPLAAGAAPAPPPPHAETERARRAARTRRGCSMDPISRTPGNRIAPGPPVSHPRSPRPPCASPGRHGPGSAGARTPDRGRDRRRGPGWVPSPPPPGYLRTTMAQRVGNYELGVEFLSSPPSAFFRARNTILGNEVVMRRLTLDPARAEDARRRSSARCASPPRCRTRA